MGRKEKKEEVRETKMGFGGGGTSTNRVVCRSPQIRNEQWCGAGKTSNKGGQYLKRVFAFDSFERAYKT